MLDGTFAKKYATDSMNDDCKDDTYPNGNWVDAVDEHGNNPLHKHFVDP